MSTKDKVEIIGICAAILFGFIGAFYVGATYGLEQSKFEFEQYKQSYTEFKDNK